jgi:hypothetical protein
MPLSKCVEAVTLVNDASSYLPDDDNTAKATPKTATVGGVKFYRSKNGNLYRSGIVKAQRYETLTDEQKSPSSSNPKPN